MIVYTTIQRGFLMEKKINQILNSIDYSTYKKIQNSFGTIGFCSAIVNIFTEYPLLDKSLDMLYYTSFIAYFSFLLSNAKLHTKDINEIRTLYQQFIKNYNQMNKDFDLKNPIQIHTMFNYLLYEGYLSKGKEF